MRMCYTLPVAVNTTTATGSNLASMKRKYSSLFVWPKKIHERVQLNFDPIFSERSPCRKSNLALVSFVCMNINCRFNITGLCFLELALIFICELHKTYLLKGHTSNCKIIFKYVLVFVFEA
jgi:hypothetical protein